MSVEWGLSPAAIMLKVEYAEEHTYNYSPAELEAMQLMYDALGKALGIQEPQVQLQVVA